VGAFLGGLAGGVSAYGKQVWNNWQNNMSLGEALTTDIDVGKIAGGAAAGAIIGGTFGAAGAAAGAAGIVGLGFWKTMAIGTGSSLVAGQVSALVEASTNEVIDHLRDQGDLSGAGLWQSAHELGFFDPHRAIIDTTSGAVAAALAYPIGSMLSKVAMEYGLVESVHASTVPPTINYLPALDAPYAITIETGRAIVLPADQFNALLLAAGQKGPESAFRWLFSQADVKITDALEKRGDE